MTRNEAAERLLDYLEEQDGSVDVTIKRTLDDALAAERRATVERIRDASHASVRRHRGCAEGDRCPVVRGDVYLRDILDEEAAR